MKVSEANSCHGVCEQNPLFSYKTTKYFRENPIHTLVSKQIKPWKSCLKVAGGGWGRPGRFIFEQLLVRPGLEIVNTLGEPDFTGPEHRGLPHVPEAVLFCHRTVCSWSVVLPIAYLQGWYADEFLTRVMRLISDVLVAVAIMALVSWDTHSDKSYTQMSLDLEKYSLNTLFTSHRLQTLVPTLC